MYFELPGGKPNQEYGWSTVAQLAGVSVWACLCSHLKDVRVLTLLFLVYAHPPIYEHNAFHERCFEGDNL
jgi:hypothetical protein